MKSRESAVEVVYAFRGAHMQEQGSAFEGAFVAHTRQRLAAVIPDDFQIYGLSDARALLDALNRKQNAHNTLLVVEAPLRHYPFYDTLRLIELVRKNCNKVTPFVFVSNLSHTFPSSEGFVPEGYANLKRRLENAHITFGAFLEANMSGVLPIWLEFLETELNALN